jgi:hypothetical protein
VLNGPTDTIPRSSGGSVDGSMNEKPRPLLTYVKVGRAEVHTSAP